MKTNILKLTAILLILAGIFSSCQKEPLPDNTLLENNLRGIWVNKESFVLSYIDFYSDSLAKFVSRVKNNETIDEFYYKRLDDNKILLRFLSDTSETIHNLIYIDDKTVKISNLTDIPENPDKTYYKCEQLTIGEKDTISLGYRHIYYDTEKDFRLQILSISNDSRCPTGANCIWEGNVEVNLDLIYGGNYQTKFTLNINPIFQIDTIIDGIYFKLLSVKPYPEEEIAINPKDYKVKILATSFQPKFFIYPNPTTSLFTIQSSELKIAEVIIYDMLGRIVGTYQGNSALSMTIDISSFQKGAYILKIKCTNGMEYAHKIVKI